MSTNNESVQSRVAGLLAQMTLEEKVALLSGKNAWQTVPIERLGIPALTMTDGPHGVRANRTGPERQHGPATSFPTGVSMAASWDPELIERVGSALAEETLALGCDILLGPCVNIVRTPLAGRNFESYAEDPYLAGKIGVGWVNGLQNRGVGASLKHYACNNQEIERMRGDSIVDERTLREIYLRQFEMVVKEADPWTVMCAYNRVNGSYASQNVHLQRDILKGEWQYEGVIISDWGANHTTTESVAGGLDIEMPGPAKYYGQLLVEAVVNWQIDESYLDDAASRILRMIVRSGRMDSEAAERRGAINTQAHQDLARELAESSVTLLKNAESVLPIADVDTIAVIGPNASEARIGGGGSSYLEPPYRISPLEGLQEVFGDDDVTLAYAKGCDNTVEPSALKPEDNEQLDQAVQLATQADVAVIFAGMPRGYESEGHDRPHMRLPGVQDALIQAVAKANPNTIVVLNCGAPVEMPWADAVPGIVLAYYPGQEGGRAVARVLTGAVNPSGKLPVTFPVHYRDNPTIMNYPGTREVRYGEGLFVGYRYYDKKDIAPLFPFGHGLSYTTFEYDNLQMPASAVQGEPVSISLTIQNAGLVTGKEVVQLYVRDPESSLVRPVKELKRFEKVTLEPGEKTEISFRLDDEALAFYDPYQGQWVVEPGQYDVLIGSSSRDIRLSGSFTLEESTDL
jgi:beta-glucosidase